mgnify:CR=1 FL=1
MQMFATEPASALFRDGGEWAVFRVEDGTTALQRITIGQNNGLQAEVLYGLADGQSVVLFPSSGLSGGMAVAQRVIK